MIKLLQGQKWQPIETAPTDGTPFLAIMHDGKQGVVAFYNESYIVGSLDCSYCESYERDDFTHWMPLPEQPTMEQLGF